MSSPHAAAPAATYRLQLHPQFPFADAEAVLGYLADLGVSHLYLSPLLAARTGSTHGYDVADPRLVAPALGGEQGLRALADAAGQRGLGLVVDIVPNHLGTGPDNPFWEQLLAEGSAGAGGRMFDVDWDPGWPHVAGKVIVPVLGAQYGEVLYNGELRIAADDGTPRLRYYEHSFPLSPESIEALERVGGPGAVEGTPGEPETWTRMHALLEQQHYRLVDWRIGDALINYRRFFAITELAAVRVEDEDVFEATHAKILELVADGVVDGLRIDHPDGLRDPGGYLERLRDRSGGCWTVVEKILEPGEQLPDWPVAGTTGYEFCNDVLGLFVDPDAEPLFDRLDREFGASALSYHEQARQAKALILERDLASDVRRLARRFWALAAGEPTTRDVDDRQCLTVLTNALQEMEVYRTYVDPATGDAGEEDVARIDAAVAAAARRGGAPPALYRFLADVLSGRAGASAEQLLVLARFQQLSGATMAKGVEDTVFYRYRRLLALNEVGGDPSRFGGDVDAFHRANRVRAQRHRTGMLSTATHDTKRGEDVRLRMAALSELGDVWVDAVRRWREENRDLVTATERGPAPDPATEYLLYQTLVGIWPLDDPEDVRPAILERAQAYAVKASREAKERTTWTEPDEAFERGVEAFLAAALDPGRSSAFLAGLRDVAGRAAAVGMVSGLAQVVLRCASPGVPDTYQGMELWDDSLVDPDNRRPVDFARRRELLAELDAGADPRTLLSQWRDGRVKLWVLSRCLRARRDAPAPFGAAGGYEPLGATGRWADHIVAFARPAGDAFARPAGDAFARPAGDGGGAVAVVPRLPGRVLAAAGAATGSAWGDTRVRLPEGTWRDVLTGAEIAGGDVAVADVLAALPVSLLLRR